MEGLIPFVYRAIVQYKNGKDDHVLPSWFNDSPSASYTRLPTGDSGRFPIESHNYGSSSSPMSTSSTAKIKLSTGVQSPAVCRLTPHRVVA
ncbi:hypothetical protein HRI_000644900 [Hibiscus trionum]|uniref:Legume-specific protein n=1 Tax=Hibiscus trionum TaxID=183268 RepID=A0A9W7LMW5_HIBTR|nr:hypothetical protein HRI_000644900 [Hibiscus trionum]